MKIGAIIQARTGSTRLPAKVLKEIGGMPMLSRVVRRTRRASLIDEVIVATTEKEEDDRLLELSKNLGVSTFRGAESDVLDRYFEATRAHDLDAVVRITSDCPFIDPGIADAVIQLFLRERPDYASNFLIRTYPRGLGVEVMTRDALERAWHQASEPHERAHVTPRIYQDPDHFQLLPMTHEVDLSDHRWTVDTPEDLAFTRAVYARLGNHDRFSWREVLQAVETEPDLAEMNRYIDQKPLEEG